MINVTGSRHVINAVILDMDGLMLDTEPLYKAAWQHASQEFGFDLDDPSYSRFIGRPTEDCEAELMERFGPEFPISQFRSRWPELWRAFAQDRGISCKPGLVALLSFLEEVGLAIAIATSSNTDYTEFSLPRRPEWRTSHIRIGLACAKVNSADRPGQRESPQHLVTLLNHSKEVIQ
jgi:beta-phosphoglucomutase-like phosphatase (HAD superfamily)